MGATGGTGGGAGGGTGGTGSRFAPPTGLLPTNTRTSAPPVSDALLEQAVKVMAGHVGPIAKVVVKRAAERTRQRDALFALLVDAAPEAVRARVAAELARLPS